MSRRRRTTGLGAAVVLALLLAGIPAAARAATRIITYSPFGPDGALRPGLTATAAFGGTCDTESFVVSGTGVLRCFAKTTIYDPCYRDAARTTMGRMVVVCVPDPWATAIVRLRATQAPGAQDGVRPAGLPWALTLASGRRCTFAPGARATVAGRRLNYVCGRRRVLFGSPDRTSATWRIRQATSPGGAGLRKVAIAAAWR